MEQTYAEDQVSDIAQKLLACAAPSNTGATVLTLQGDLGAGKTTLTKAVAKELGITETVVSPTFVIAKFYELSGEGFKSVVHVDAYRIESLDELKPLGWEMIIQQPNTLVIVEWPERIREALPHGAKEFVISHQGDKRTIKQVA